MKQRSLLVRSFAAAAVAACLQTGCSGDRNREQEPGEGTLQVDGGAAELTELAAQLARLNQQIATSSDESKRQRAEIIALLVEIRTELRNR